MNCQLLHGDCREVLKTLPAESVNCCVTSPPYWGLRDYGVAGQIGLEPTPEAYVAELVAVFREVRRVLRNDGTLWLNLGDSYSARLRQSGPEHAGKLTQSSKGVLTKITRDRPPDCKEKDLIGIPWMVAFALRADGWYLRQDIIWHKPNPMPESVTDRCTKAHEYVFLLSKSAKYYYDAKAIKEPVSDQKRTNYSSGIDSKTPTNAKDFLRTRSGLKNLRDSGCRMPIPRDEGLALRPDVDQPNPLLRNLRSVWTVATKSYREAHFAAFPPALITPMILAGCPSGGTVLDPFGGSGTTGEVAESLGRNSILIELNPAYIEIQGRRTAQQGLSL
jgi:DNA modification methylase